MSKQKQTLFRGAATALVTPFCDGRIDFEAFGRLIDRQIEQGIDALVVVGTTGESATLTEKEKIALIAYAAARVDGRVPLIAGSGCADTAHTMQLSREACAAGADTYLSGELKHNWLTDAPDLGINLVAAGHFYTEDPVCRILRDMILNADQTVTVTVTNSNPVRVF
jgi:putative NIF3 family GTP cyclohydrolase 1 type 2